MNYELKSVQPLSVFINSLRTLLVLGFVIAVITYFISPSPDVRIEDIGHRLLAVVTFTLIWSFGSAIALTIAAFVYNFWTASFKGIKVHFEQE